MATMPQVSVKEYDSIIVSCEYTDDSGNPVNLSGISVLSDMKSLTNKLVAHLAVTIDDVHAGKFTLKPIADYIEVGFYQIDILFVSLATGHRVSSETFRLNIVSAVTSPRG